MLKFSTKSIFSSSKPSLPSSGGKSTAFAFPKPKPFVFQKQKSFFGSTQPMFANKTLLSIGKLNHVAIAVGNLENAVKLYRETLGAKVSEPVPQVEHGVTTVFVDLGNTKIELLHPLGDKSPIKNFLDKKPEGGVHHICIEVDDIELAVKELNTQGVKIIDPKPKIGAHGKPVVFLHPKSMNGVLVELEQK